MDAIPSVKDRIRAMQGSGAVKPSPKSEEVCYMAPTSLPVFQGSKSTLKMDKSPQIEEALYNGPKSDSVTYMSPKSQVLSNDSDPYMFKMVDMSEFRTSPSKTSVEYSTPTSILMQSEEDTPSVPKLLRPNHQSHLTLKDHFNRPDLPVKVRRISEVFEETNEIENAYVEAADATSSPTFRKKMPLRHISTTSDDVGSVTSPTSPARSPGDRKKSVVVIRGNSMYDSFISLPEIDDIPEAGFEPQNKIETSSCVSMATSGLQSNEVYLDLESKESNDNANQALDQMGGKITHHKIFGQKKVPKNEEPTDHVTVINQSNGKSTTVKLRKPRDSVQERPTSMPFAPPPEPPSPPSIYEGPQPGHSPGNRPLPAPPILTPGDAELDEDHRLLERNSSLPPNPPPSPPNANKPPPLLPRTAQSYLPKLPYRPPSPYLRNSIPEFSLSPPASPNAPALPDRNPTSPKRPISTPERPVSDFTETPERKIHPIAQMLKLRKVAGSAENVGQRTTNKGFRGNSRSATSELPPIPVFAGSESVPNLTIKPNLETKPKPPTLTKPSNKNYPDQKKSSPTKSAEKRSLYPSSPQHRVSLGDLQIELAQRSPLRIPPKSPPKIPLKPEGITTPRETPHKSPSTPAFREPMPLPGKPQLKTKPFDTTPNDPVTADGKVQLTVRKNPPKRDGYTLHLLQNQRLKINQSLAQSTPPETETQENTPQLYSVIPDPPVVESTIDPKPIPSPKPTLETSNPVSVPRSTLNSTRSPRIKPKPRPSVAPPPRPSNRPPPPPIHQPPATSRPRSKTENPKSPSEVAKVPPTRPPPPTADKIIASKMRQAASRVESEKQRSPTARSPLKSNPPNRPIPKTPVHKTTMGLQENIDEDEMYSAINDYSSDSFSTNTSEDNSSIELQSGARETPKKKKLSLGSIASSVSTLKQKLARHRSRDAILESSPYSAASDVGATEFGATEFGAAPEGVYAGIDDFGANANWNSNSDIYLAAIETRSFVYAELDHTAFVGDDY